jgi:TPR repeat protein
MSKRLGAISVVLLALAIAALRCSPAHSQSADLVLCDRVAADPADPDKPKDVKGVAVIAPADVETAIKFCKTAAAGSRRALFALGRAYAANGQMQEAVTAFRRAIDKGSTAAMIELGVLFGTGNGIARDEAQARKLFERAAAAGNPRGNTNLAALSGGGSAPTDRGLLTKAAEGGSAEAQYQLGVMLANGVGGEQDDFAARTLFEKAAAQSHSGALLAMGVFAQDGRGGAEDSRAAKSYYERAIALGNEDAKAALKRLECPRVLKDKRGNILTHLCF